MQLEITPTNEGFRLEGELDMATADDLTQLLRASTDNDPLVLDFSGVSFMDSSGLRALLEGPANGNARLVILNPTPQVRRVLDISIPGGTPGLEVRDDG
ncbi:MAG: STAS domain-containing protein [Actinomycetota bacterium]